ncbi:hypothetical protein ALO_21546 [Acetonema longum DSM 6540]|uniref:Toxin SymE-like domain-containing protein n=1 Tax=Acetonema longum DSM 6540 TaxID=1009370 RepID=F7NQA7_9FIRM|nr:hypothetical protein ALO_21546 [Acetonema longum DSM 6540]
MRGVFQMVRTLTVSSVLSHRIAFGPDVEVPFIRLRGKWLEPLGFQVGSKVQVYAYPAEIILKLVKEDVSYGKD